MNLSQVLEPGTSAVLCAVNLVLLIQISENGVHGEQQLSIHQLLCKKVAQLTKVVYQLNVKSEDRDIDLNLIAKSYEAQIDQMATDNEQKVRQVQEQFRKHQQDLEAEVTKL